MDKLKLELRRVWSKLDGRMEVSEALMNQRSLGELEPQGMQVATNWKVQGS